MFGKKTAWLWILGMILTTWACDSNHMYDDSLSVPETGWHKDNLIQFKVEVPDTTSPYNFFLNLRNNTDYNYSNAFFFLKTTYPSGQLARDTIQIIVADHRGKWLGKGFGRIKDQQIQLRKEMTFPQQGLYIFEIQHGMRTDTLFGIEDVGIRIEKAISE
ncbi:MAG: gliding motility lipoprotein GldH [Bacteroidales bacterium]|nr:gliding motility lipoprotein GldH [Bacteroidales bacterium]